MAAPAVATTSSLVGAQRTSIPIPVPTGVAVGDVLVVCMYVNTTGTVTPSSGFTEITPAPQTTDPTVLRTWWKNATAADSGTYTFSVASSWTEVSCLRITGAAAGSAVAQIGQASTNTSTTTAPAVTGSTTGPNRLLVYAQTALGASGTSYTPPTGYSEQYDSTAGWLETATITQATQGSVGSVSGTCAATGTRNASLVEVLPSIPEVAVIPNRARFCASNFL